MEIIKHKTHDGIKTAHQAALTNKFMKQIRCSALDYFPSADKWNFRVYDHLGNTIEFHEFKTNLDRWKKK